MPIDPNIALQVKPLQLNDPLAQYAQVSQIQSAQQANQLNNLKMQEYQRGLQEENQLRQLIKSGIDLNSPEAVNQMYAISPTKGLEFQTKQAAIKKAGLETSKLENEAIDVKLKQARQFLDTIDPADPNAPARYIAWHEANHRDPVIGKVLAARGVTADQSRAAIDAAIARGPEAFATLLNQSKLGTEKFIELNKPQNISVNRGGRTDIISTPGLGGAPTTIGNFPDVPLPPDVFAQQIQKSAAGAARTNVVMPAQEKEFEKELGSGQAKAILTSRTAAQDAAQILQTNQIGRDILKSGAITGAGADFFVGLNQALKTAGVDAGRADAAANSQAYAAAMASNTGKLIKQYGAGTGLSDADRDYAAAAAGGKIAMDEKAIRKVLDINDRAARNVINDHNKKVKGIKTNIPLTVEMPSTGGGTGGFTYLGKESK